MVIIACNVRGKNVIHSIVTIVIILKFLFVCWRCIGDYRLIAMLVTRRFAEQPRSKAC